MRRIRNSQRAELWRDRLARQAAGPWSVAEFCRREGVSQPAFYQWRKRLGRTARGTPPAKRPESHADVAFVPVELPDSWALAGVRIDLPGGAVVRLPADASAELLAAAVRAARDVPTAEEAPRC